MQSPLEVPVKAQLEEQVGGKTTSLECSSTHKFVLKFSHRNGLLGNLTLYSKYSEGQNRSQIFLWYILFYLHSDKL
jgi:hypothetical protein